MHIHPLHAWDLAPADVPALQTELAARLDTRSPLTGWELVAGADVSYNRFSTTCYAAVVVLKATDCSIVEKQTAVGASTFPYIPGMFTFREAPVLLEAFARVQSRPDVVMFDGQGIAHPRRLGIAAHVGLWLQVPSLGCAKSLLHGKYGELAAKVGAVADIKAKGEVVGYAVRTKKGVKPVFVSSGHLIDLPSAVRAVLASCQGYRLPEPARQAHLLSNEMRRAAAVQ
jgi:deoxyribonuclease V